MLLEGTVLAGATAGRLGAELIAAAISAEGVAFGAGADLWTRDICRPSLLTAALWLDLLSAPSAVLLGAEVLAMGNTPFVAL